MESSNQSTPEVTVNVTTVPSMLQLFKAGWQFLTTRSDIVKWYLISIVVMSVLNAEMTYNLIPLGLTGDALLGLGFFVTVVFLIINSWILLYAVAQPELHAVTYQTAKQWVLKNFLPLVWTSIVSSVLLLFSYLLLIIPGVIFSVYWYFAHYAQATGAGAGTKALRQSYRDVKGMWRQTFFKLLIATFYLVVLYAGLMSIFILGLLVFGEGSWGVFIADVISQSLAGGALGVVSVYALGHYHKYLRSHQEGIDKIL